MKKQPNFYYVYLITNLALNNKQYVGSKICYKDDPNTDGYMGSSKYVDADVKIYGVENFAKEIIDASYKNKNDMLNGETFYILKYNTLEPNGYNRYLPNTKPGFHMGGCHHSKESKEKIRKKNIGKHKGPLSESHKQKLRKPMTELTKQKLRKPRSEQTKQNMKDNRANFAKENNPMFGKLVYDIYIKKYGKEEGEKRINKRILKASNSLKLSGKGRNFIWVTLDNINKRIKKEQLENYLNNGWIRGMSKETGKKISESLSNIKNKSNKKCWIHNDIKNIKINITELQDYLNDDWAKGRLPLSDNTKKKIKDSIKGKIMLNNNIKNILITKDKIQYLNNGWIKGRKKETKLND